MILTGTIVIYHSLNEFERVVHAPMIVTDTTKTVDEEVLVSGQVVPNGHASMRYVSYVPFARDPREPDHHTFTLLQHHRVLERERDHKSRFDHRTFPNPGNETEETAAPESEAGGDE